MVEQLFSDVVHLRPRFRYHVRGLHRLRLGPFGGALPGQIEGVQDGNHGCRDCKEYGE